MKKRFWSCEEMCPCDDYTTVQDPILAEWANMVLGGAGSHLWCPHCNVLCTEVLEYEEAPPPFRVDGDGWWLRDLRPGEDPGALDALVGGDGFVDADRALLYLHSWTGDRLGRYA